MPLNREITASATVKISSSVTAEATGSVGKVATNANGVIESNLTQGSSIYTKKEIDSFDFIKRIEAKEEFVEQKKFLTNLEIEDLLTNDD